MHTHLCSEIFYGSQKLHTYFCSLRVRGTSLLIYSCIGELRNGRKFKYENKPFIVLIITLRRVLSCFFFLIQLKFTVVGINSA